MSSTLKIDSPQIDKAGYRQLVTEQVASKGLHKVIEGKLPPTKEVCICA